MAYYDNYGLQPQPYGQQPNYQNGYRPMYQDPYGSNYNNQYNNQAYMQNAQAQQQNNQMFLPLTYVNGVEGAKAYTMPPNKKIYLMDAENNIIYEKISNNEGRCQLKAKRMIDIEIDDIGKNPNNVKQNSVDLSTLATKSELEKLKADLDQQISKLSQSIDSNFRKPKNQNYNGGKQ